MSRLVSAMLLLNRSGWCWVCDGHAAAADKDHRTTTPIRRHAASVPEGSLTWG
jgi:hypothetical protein